MMHIEIGYFILALLGAFVLGIVTIVTVVDTLNRGRF